MKDLRPISLCNVRYRILTKVFTNRICQAIDERFLRRLLKYSLVRN
ncbi:hypothetical protein LINGRAHAP2_LOCUS9883 [Linum grandiflorum]